MAQRLVSVVIGTRDRPDTLREALASIRALEGPDLRFEILVGDNGTSPETPAVVAEFGGVYGRTDVYGCPAARNVAMRNITGEFVAFLDDDDVWLPGHIRPHIAMLDAHPEFEAVFSQILTADQALNPTGVPWPAETPADNDFFHMMMSGYFPQVGGTVVRARAVQRHGLMDEALIGDSDWDWQLRIARDHRIGFVSQPCVLFRQRPPGSFDKLQLRRAGYTRRIFLRHAPDALRRLKSPSAMLRAYRGALAQYFDHFMQAAIEWSECGQHAKSVRPVAFAFSVFPLRTLKQVFTRASVRKAFWKGLFDLRPPSQEAMARPVHAPAPRHTGARRRP